MMNFLVLSDTHGNDYLLRRVLTANRAVDGVLFLGDGLDELEELSLALGAPPVFAVRGNCDSDFSPLRRPREEELLLSFMGHRLLLLHGHTVSVKLSEGGLVARARALGADIVLYGHTHVPAESYRPPREGGPLWLFNPGSLGRPYDCRPSFGRLTLDDRGSVLLSHGVWEDGK